MPRLRVAPGLAIGASADYAIRLPSWTGSSCPPHRTQCACICARRTHRRAPTPYCRYGIPLRDFCSRLRSTTPIHPVTVAKEKWGTMRRKKCTIRFGLLQTFHGLRFLLSCSTYVIPSALSVSFADIARQLLEFGLSSVHARCVDWFAVELVGGMCVSLHDGWRALLGEIACAAVGGLGEPSRRRRRSASYKGWRRWCCN